MSASQLPVIDMAFATEQTMGDPDFLSELLHEMLKDEEKKTHEMDEGLKQDDHIKLQEAAHYIKGAAANLGLKGLEDAATKLDALGKELKKGNLSHIDQRKELVEQLKSEFSRFRKYVNDNHL